MSIYRLTLAWISSENSTTHEECWFILTRLPSLLWTSSHPTGLSAVRCGLPCPSSIANCLLLSPFVSLSDWCSLPTSGHVEISSPNPLSGFAPKQIKGSSAGRTTYTVLHSRWQCCWFCCSKVEVKLSPFCRELPEGPLFNCYYTEV